MRHMGWTKGAALLALPLGAALAIVVALSHAEPLSAEPNVQAFVVNNTSDVPDANAGNGVCETAAGNGICTLRAAIMEANAMPGGNIVILQPNATYVLLRSGDDNSALNGDLDVTDDLTLTVPSGTATIDGNGLAVLDRVFHIPGTALLALYRIRVQNGYALGDYGGGIYNALGNLRLHYSTLQGSWAMDGGGIYNGFWATTSLFDSIVRDNVTYQFDHSGGMGGGIYNRGHFMLARSAVISNSSYFYGGGIRNEGVFDMINTTVSGNRAGYHGKGIYNGASLQMYNVSLVRNYQLDQGYGQSGEGGGIYNTFTGTVTLKNTLIAANSALNGNDCSGKLTSGGYNLVDQFAKCIGMTDGVNGDKVDTSLYFLSQLKIGPLQARDGLPPAHPPLRGSIVIDAGNPGGCEDHTAALLLTDQQGRDRIVDGDGIGGARCDLGAYEFSWELFLPLIRR